MTPAEPTIPANEHEQMLDAQASCVPCRLCGGSAVITDAGIGAGYYIKCSNHTTWRPSKGCLIGEERLGGWAYNVRDWWNRLHTPRTPEPTGDTREQVGRVEVTTADRERWIEMDDLDGMSAQACREGRYDNCVGVQLLAKHRLAALPPARDAEVERLREALRPFAREADQWESFVSDHARILYIDEEEEAPQVTLADFRRARAALSASDGKEGVS